MATLRQIKRRIRSIQSTAKITHAMELVAASKMRRAQARALATRPYAERLRWLLADLAENRASQEAGSLPALLQKREVASTIAIVLTPDRGLCGGLNASLNRRAAAFALEQPHPVKFVCVGRQGRDFLYRTEASVLAEFTGLGDYPSYEDIIPVGRLIADSYISGEADRAVVIYPLFVNTVTQIPEIRTVLPVEPPEDSATLATDYIYEPSRQTVLEEVLPRYLEMQIFEAVLELLASEQSARMVAMRSATENANQMIEDLTLVYNKARQEQITRELLDITGGVEALKVS